MERQSPYLPPSEPPRSGGTSPEYVPPRNFVDYWNWSRIRDDRDGVRTGRLAPWLRDAARTRNPQEILRRAVVAAFRPTTDNALAESQALADLAVTGRAAFTNFTASPPRDEALFTAVRSDLAGIAPAQIREAVRRVLDRSYTVAWALRGSPSQRRALRPSLGWIAVSSEDDPPHSPTNVPATEEHMGELSLGVGRSAQQLTLRGTLMLPTVPGADPLPDIARRPIPAPTAFTDALRNRAAAGYDELFLFVHGLGSRAEESESFKRKLIEMGWAADRRYAILSVDMPGMGYSSRLDLDDLVARRARGHHGFALPNGAGSNFPLLGLYRDTLVEICNSTVGGIQYVMGGSLGGNMTLWLAAEPMFTDLDPARSAPSSVISFLSWSPASIWASYERDRQTPFDVLVTPGTHFHGDVSIGKDGAKSRPFNRMNERENNSSRWSFFDLMQRGEPIIGSLRIRDLTGGWGYPPTREGLLLQSELYSEQYRRVFWTACYEQVTFSHQEPLTPSGRWPFQTISKPLFLAAGAQDVGKTGVMDIYNPVVAVSDRFPELPGRRHLMLETGHSISDERPHHLARQIVDFLVATVPPRIHRAKAWVWADRPTSASYTPATNYQYNSAGGTIQIRRSDTGVYRVDIPRLGTSGGMVHAVAYGGSHYCRIAGWGRSGDTQRITVACYNPVGELIDGHFVLLFYKESRGATWSNAYLVANRPFEETYTPNTTDQWNSKGGLNTFRRLNRGHYQVTLPGINVPGGTVLVTSYGLLPARCKVGGWGTSGNDTVVTVYCFDFAGNPTDAQFTLSFMTDVGLGSRFSEDQHYGGYIWANEPTSASYTPSRTYQLNTTGSSINTITRSSTGSYTVNLPRLAPSNSSAALAVAYGSGSEYCTVQGWSGDGGDGTNATVQCFSSSGTPIDTQFTLVYLTDDLVLS
jgi:pimeloyl-ACP methyl ester carboxylesterase